MENSVGLNNSESNISEAVKQLEKVFFDKINAMKFPNEIIELYNNRLLQVCEKDEKKAVYFIKIIINYSTTSHNANKEKTDYLFEYIENYIKNNVKNTTYITSVVFALDSELTVSEIDEIVNECKNPYEIICAVKDRLENNKVNTEDFDIEEVKNTIKRFNGLFIESEALIKNLDEKKENLLTMFKSDIDEYIEVSKNQYKEELIDIKNEEIEHLREMRISDNNIDNSNETITKDADGEAITEKNSNYVTDIPYEVIEELKTSIMEEVLNSVSNDLTIGIDDVDESLISEITNKIKEELPINIEDSNEKDKEIEELKKQLQEEIEKRIIAENEANKYFTIICNSLDKENKDVNIKDIFGSNIDASKMNKNIDKEPEIRKKIFAFKSDNTPIEMKITQLMIKRKYSADTINKVTFAVKSEKVDKNVMLDMISNSKNENELKTYLEMV